MRISCLLELEMAEKLINGATPLLASNAFYISVFDKLMNKTVEEFKQLVYQEVSIFNV